MFEKCSGFGAQSGQDMSGGSLRVVAGGKAGTGFVWVWLPVQGGDIHLTEASSAVPVEGQR